jgi:hypothetical protein
MTKKSKGADIDGLVKMILKGNDDINVVVGPMLWQPADRGNGAKDWYFCVSVSKKGEWYSLKIEDPDYEPTQDLARPSSSAVKKCVACTTAFASVQEAGSRSMPPSTVRAASRYCFGV